MTVAFLVLTPDVHAAMCVRLFRETRRHAFFNQRTGLFYGRTTYGEGCITCKVVTGGGSMFVVLLCCVAVCLRDPRRT